MMKKLALRLAFLAVATFSIQSCRTEEDLIQNPQETEKRFQAFTSRNGESVDYPRGYKLLLEKYDSLYSTAYTSKTFFKNSMLGKSGSEEYVELNIRSQELMMKNDTERWILYPVVKEKEVIGIEVGILKNNESQLEFWRMDPQDDYYKEIIGSFCVAYSEKILEQQTMSKGGNCGRPGEEPCDTGEVVITIPKPNGPKANPHLYLPGANPGSGDPGVIGGNCGAYGNCGGGGYGENQNDSNSDSCQKVKEKQNNQKYKDKFEALNKAEIFNMDKETGFYELQPPLGVNTPPGFVQVDGPPGSTGMDLPDNTDRISGLFHSHNNAEGSVKIFSPTDVRTFINTFLKNARTYGGGYGNAYSTLVTSAGSYTLRFTGTTHPGGVDYNTGKAWGKWYKDEIEKIRNEDGDFPQDKVEDVFGKFLHEVVKKPGLEVFKVTATTAEKMTYDPITKKSNSKPCP
ncbi:hypothetical protein [Chryseobacterium kwangjuense]|uniref:DUF4329 domain-containing protein n=1 Tax=Chryseobacterium kwangjuense TaxID=267125 RepID=A0A135WI36_9FLAO|nr:hypothetical protein [Chryseobacterium kwangjuense]KXH84579.1 hypothetical protein AU378_02095 [Chryseobacterium kwangjuense]